MERSRDETTGDGSMELPMRRDAARRFLSLAEVASFLGVDKADAERWVAEGRLTATILPSGGFRVATDEFLVFVRRIAVGTPRAQC